jgi:AcrR family transcriptional regulator
MIEAAYRVVGRDGAGALTLDAVSREAGVSKGGLLYHFPTKDALIAGLIDHYIASFEAALERHLEAEAEAPGRWLRAYVNASFEDDLADLGPNEGAGLLAAVASNPALLDPIRARALQEQERAAADGVDPARVTLIRLTLDGMVFADLFGVAPRTAEQREQLRETLLAMTREPAP